MSEDNRPRLFQRDDGEYMIELIPGSGCFISWKLERRSDGEHLTLIPMMPIGTRVVSRSDDGILDLVPGTTRH